MVGVVLPQNRIECCVLAVETRLAVKSPMGCFPSPIPDAEGAGLRMDRLCWSAASISNFAIDERGASRN